MDLQLSPKDMDVQSLCKAIKLINHLAVELDISAAMDSVRQVALELLQCDRVTLFLVIEHRKELRARTGDGSTVVVPFGEGIAGQVAQNGGLMNIPDAYSHPQFYPVIDKCTKYSTRNILCCAITDFSGDIIAVLQALNKHCGSFTEADEQHLQLFGVHLGNTLAKARFYEEAKREKARLASLSKCFKHLNAVTCLSGALDTIAAAVKELVCGRHVVVLLMDSARQTLWTSITNANTGGIPQLFRVQQGQGIIGACAEHKKQAAMCFKDQPGTDDKVHQLYAMLSSRRRQLTDLLLQPVLDPATNNCMAVLVALNKNERPAGCDIFYEPTFSPSDCDALAVFSMEVADLLSQRALEVSFASAMSVVQAGAGAAQEQLSSMLKAQLLDYFNSPHGMGSGDLGSSGSSQLLHRSASMSTHYQHNRELEPIPDDDGEDFSLPPSALQRCSSTAKSGTFSTDTTPLASPLSPMRSFHHHLPPLLASRTPSHLASMRCNLLTWELDCAPMADEALVRLAYDVFMLSGVLEELAVPEAELSGFLSAVASHYHSEVPYHNLAHAVQVLHTVWMLLETTTARNVLSAGEELVLLVAAICHDIDHDGFTNSYHINSQSELAQRYNDRSVQENHHCALTFAVLRRGGSNLLSRFTDRSEYQAARRLLVEAILATDMHHHFALTQELQKHSLVFMADEETDRALLIKALLHAADISNPVRPFPAALGSAERVHTEFRRQAARERELDLPVAPHMDATDPAVWAKMEVQFIDYVAGPLWERLGQIFPTLQQPISMMHINRAKFMAMAQSTPHLEQTSSTTSSQAAASSSTDTGSSNSSANNNSSSNKSYFDGSSRRPWSSRVGGAHMAAVAAFGVQALQPIAAADAGPDGRHSNDDIQEAETVDGAGLRQQQEQEQEQRQQQQQLKPEPDAAGKACGSCVSPKGLQQQQPQQQQPLASDDINQLPMANLEKLSIQPASWGSGKVGTLFQ